MGPLHGVERGVGSYVAGAELTLLPMNQITRPYGINHFPWPFFTKSGRRKEPLPRNLDTRPSGLFDPEAEPDKQLCHSVLKTLSGGFDKGTQVLLCEILEAPSVESSRYIPLKLGDRIVADQDPSRGALVLLYMHRIGRDETSKEEPLYRQLTGGKLLAPEYHSVWAIELDGASRYIGAVAMEFIDGPLYHIDESSEHGILDMSDESRLKILADILEQLVNGFSFGVKREDFHLEDFIVTYLRKGKRTERPSVVKVKYGHHGSGKWH
ncbi:hypothetical protein GQ607_017133 [Colletotrichum asianum]|uniref:Uncharacterized protein n=1 Tax=Colletotrichum asianum TaxID=702518 RepID=A0A8H3VSH1_9PEZI|nr:hypothetical protein GQ607_017133 [Colletotrichum asianum]